MIKEIVDGVSLYILERLFSKRFYVTEAIMRDEFTRVKNISVGYGLHAAKTKGLTVLRDEITECPRECSKGEMTFLFTRALKMGAKTRTSLGLSVQNSPELRRRYLSSNEPQELLLSVSARARMNLPR